MLPALSYHFGLKWADIVSMPSGELDAYLRALDEFTRDRS